MCYGRACTNSFYKDADTQTVDAQIVEFGIYKFFKSFHTTTLFFLNKNVASDIAAGTPSRKMFNANVIMEPITCYI